MIALPRVHHHRIDVDGVEVFYRESVPDRVEAPVLLLLHGFPRPHTNSADSSTPSAGAIGSSPPTTRASGTPRHQRTSTTPSTGWPLDQHFLELPGRQEAQVALAFDYKSNVARYPEWQAWLRKHTPPALIVWGANDPFFPEPGARAYLTDLPEAELHLFDTGHFALEDHLPQIASLIAAYLDRLPV